MKCAYHPGKEASARCSVCQKPLCEDCVDQKTGERTFCSRCSALSAAQDALSGHAERQAEHLEKKAEAARKAKRPKVAITVILILAGLVLLANAYMFMGPEAPAVAQFDPYEYPMITAELINEGLNDYADQHEGRFPANLRELLGKHIPYDQITPSVLDMFSYRRLSPTSYELRFKDQTNEEIADIVFSEEDS